MAQYQNFNQIGVRDMWGCWQRPLRSSVNSKLQPRQAFVEQVIPIYYQSPRHRELSRVMILRSTTL